MANSRVEEAMQTLADNAKAEAARRYPGLREALVSIANHEAIVDVKQKNGKWTRFRYVEVDGSALAAEAADASSRIKVVKQGELT